MQDGQLLKNILHHNDEPVYLWEYIPINNKYGCNDIRIYYKPHELCGSGVEIYVLEFVSTASEIPWDPLEMTAQVIYQANCYFDGLRHLYMNPCEEDMEGYLNYVDLRVHIEIYKSMQSLIEKYCRDWNE